MAFANKYIIFNDTRIPLFTDKFDVFNGSDSNQNCYATLTKDGVTYYLRYVKSNAITTESVDIYTYNKNNFSEKSPSNLNYSNYVSVDTNKFEAKNVNTNNTYRMSPSELITGLNYDCDCITGQSSPADCNCIDKSIQYSFCECTGVYPKYIPTGVECNCFSNGANYSNNGSIYTYGVNCNCNTGSYNGVNEVVADLPGPTYTSNFPYTVSGTSTTLYASSTNSYNFVDSGGTWHNYTYRILTSSASQQTPSTVWNDCNCYCNGGSSFSHCTSHLRGYASNCNCIGNAYYANCHCSLIHSVADTSIQYYTSARDCNCRYHNDTYNRGYVSNCSSISLSPNYSDTYCYLSSKSTQIYDCRANIYYTDDALNSKNCIKAIPYYECGSHPTFRYYTHEYSNCNCNCTSYLGDNKYTWYKSNSYAWYGKGGTYRPDGYYDFSNCGTNDTSGHSKYNYFSDCYNSYGGTYWANCDCYGYGAPELTNGNWRFSSASSNCRTSFYTYSSYGYVSTNTSNIIGSSAIAYSEYNCHSIHSYFDSTQCNCQCNCQNTSTSECTFWDCNCKSITSSYTETSAECVSNGVIYTFCHCSEISSSIDIYDSNNCNCQNTLDHWTNCSAFVSGRLAKSQWSPYINWTDWSGGGTFTFNNSVGNNCYNDDKPYAWTSDEVDYSSIDKSNWSNYGFSIDKSVQGDTKITYDCNCKSVKHFSNRDVNYFTPGGNRSLEILPKPNSVIVTQNQ